MERTSQLLCYLLATLTMLIPAIILTNIIATSQPQPYPSFYRGAPVLLNILAPLPRIRLRSTSNEEQLTLYLDMGWAELLTYRQTYDIPYTDLISMIPYILPLEVYTRWSQPLILYLNIRLDTSCSATGRTRGFSTLGLPRHAASLHSSLDFIFMLYTYFISIIYCQQSLAIINIL